MQRAENISAIFDQMLSKMESLNCGFEEAAQRMVDWVNKTPDFLDLVDSIGCIPESIGHDSTSEKLFAKVSDAVLSRGFRELGLKSIVLAERGDSGDVHAESKIFGYSLVADAKAFRLSRTAKNQKDYKIVALSNWRKDADYAVLCAPYFQYPNTKSQIYQQSLTENVFLFSWEHLSFMLRSNIKESFDLNLSNLWNWPNSHLKVTMGDRLKECYLQSQDDFIVDLTKTTKLEFDRHMQMRIAALKERGGKEVNYWVEQIEEVKSLTREEAIQQLINARKMNSKIETIKSYVNGLEYGA